MSESQTDDLCRNKIVCGLPQPTSVIEQVGAHAFIGNYRISTTEATIEPIKTGGSGFLWDPDAAPGADLALNEFQLGTTALHGPNIFTSAGGYWLMIEPQFDVRYKSHHYAARLGEIRLVESQRFLTLNNGERITLLDTQTLGKPVLYLQDSEDTAVVRQQSPWQMVGESKAYSFNYRITQALPGQWHGNPVRDVTVLEQYTSFFMEKPLSDPFEHSIWVPTHAAIDWGWSIRVEQKPTGWAITRRKLMLPTVSNDPWQLPQWQSNTLEC